MNALRIENVQVLEPGRGVVGCAVLVRDGLVQAIDPGGQAEGNVPKSSGTAEQDSAIERIDGGGRLLTPGLIDLHIHGIETCLFERSAEEMIDGLGRLAAYGVTACLPTFYRVMERASLDHLGALAAAAESSPVAAGLHLEGPFLALAGAGAATLAGDVGLLKELLAAGGGRVSAMSISPDTPGIVPVIEHLSASGVVPFITHTRASVEQTEAAIAAGARHATHFYDVFPLPDETEPGVRPAGAVEAILADPRISVDFIPDGVHVHPAAIRAALAAKGGRGVLAITDANIGAGLGAGTYPTSWGFSVRVQPGDGARIHRPGAADDGALAGSTLTMDAAMANLLRWVGPGLGAAGTWAMTTANPARLMGLSGRGTLLPGAKADLVLWDEAPLRAARTWQGGRLVYSRAE